MAAPKGNKNHFKHGGVGTRLYHIWKTMRQRCNNPNNCKYPIYGARGIRICDEWNDFARFREWAESNGYSEDLTIDRVDNDGNYEPNNCRWVDMTTQANNKSTNRIITIDGESMTMAEFCRKYNFKYKQFMKKIKEGSELVANSNRFT